MLVYKQDPCNQKSAGRWDTSCSEKTQPGRAAIERRAQGRRCSAASPVTNQPCQPCPCLDEVCVSAYVSWWNVLTLVLFFYLFIQVIKDPPPPPPPSRPPPPVSMQRNTENNETIVHRRHKIIKQVLCFYYNRSAMFKVNPKR